MFVQVLVVLALAAALVVVAALVTLHLLPTGLSPVRDAVSAYGVSRYRGLYRVQTLATAVSAAALATALAIHLPSSMPATASLAVLAVSRALISWFPMDADGAPRTTTGRAHNLLAFAAFAAASVSGFMVGIAFSSSPAYAALAPAVTAFGWIATAASAVTLLAARVRALAPVFGIAERLIYAGMLGVLVLGSIALVGG